MELIITALIVGFALFSLCHHYYKSLQSTDNCGCGGCGGCGGTCGSCISSDTHKSENETKPSKPDPILEPTKITMVAKN